jgi:hypothetical protein
MLIILIILCVSINLTLVYYAYNKYRFVKNLEFKIGKVEFQLDMSVEEKNEEIELFLEENKAVKVVNMYYEQNKSDQKINFENCDYIYINYATLSNEN